MKNLFAPLSRKIALAAGVALAVVVGTYVFATATVTPATGGTNISIDTTSASGGSGTYVVLTGGPVITENTVGDISTGIHTLTLPSGWEFDTAQNVTIGIGGATELTLGAQVITPSTNSLSFNVTAVSSTGPATLTFNNLKVRPTTTTPSSGSITHTAGTIVGVTNGSTNFATLSTVAGSATQLAFTTQPSATTVYGSSFATSPVVKTKDQFGNDTTAGIGASKMITLALTGTGNATGTLSLDIGSSSGNGTVTFGGITIDDIGTGNFFTASASGVTSTTSATFSITAKTLTATSTVATKVYDGATSTSVLTASLVGIVGSDVVTVSTTSASASFVTASAGNGKSANVSGLVLGGAHASKYTFDGTATGTGDITPLGVTVTASSTQSKVYGDTDPTFDYTLSAPLISGNTITGALARVTGQNVGTYAINQGTLSAGSNYSITFVSNNFSITARPITVTAATSTKVYDATTTSSAVPVITNGSLAFSDSASFTQTFAVATVGTGTTLIPTGTVIDGNSGNNYAITFVNTTGGTITAKGLTVSGLSASNKVYDGATSTTITGSGTLVGVVGTDSVTLSGSATGAFSTPNVGTSTVTVSGLSLTGADAGNYSLTSPTLSAAITPLGVTVTASSTQSKVYGDTDPTFDYTLSAPLISGNTITGALARVTGQNVGTYAINQGTLSAGSNYSITFVSNNFSITARPITVTATSTQSKVFGDSDPVFAYSITSGNLVSGDVLTGTTTRAAGENAGTYTISQGSLAATSNYALTFTSGIFTIVKATPVVSWSAPSGITYGTLLSPTQLNATSPTPGAYVYSPASSTLLNAGNNQILSVTFTPTDTANYNNVTATTTINVAKATPVITWATPSAITAGVALSGTQLNASSSVAGTFLYTPVSGTSFSTVGNQTLSTDFTPTDSANYNSVASTTVVISVVPASISQLILSASATSSDISSPVTLTITGKDQFGNVVTANNTTVVVVSADNGGALGSGLLTLSSGATTTTLTKNRAGVVNVTVSSGILTPAQSVITFTDASDVTAPSPSGITATSTLNTGTISFSSNEVGTAKIGYGLTSIHGNLTGYVSMATSSVNTITLTGLTCGTTYHYSVYAKDASGNESVSSNAQFSTLACVTGDVTAPTITAHTPLDNSTTTSVSTTVGITFNEAMDAATLNGGTVQLRTYSDDNSVPVVLTYNPATYVVTLTPVSDLQYSTQYYVYVVGAKDVAGNTVATDYSSSTKAIHEFTTGAQSNGTLAVTGINTINSTMTADNSFTNGGSWTFLVTVPTTETHLAMKFGDWVSGSNSIPAATNIRLYSAQSSNATSSLSAVTISAANTYSTDLLLTGDLDSVTAGRQVSVTVDLRVPTSTVGGSYSTNYSVRSN